MKNFLALAAFAALLSGCDFVGGSGVDPVAFSGITITTRPLTNHDADGSAPDLYVEIQDAGGRGIFQAPSVFENADEPSLSYTITSGGELYGSTRSYYIVLMDRNSDGYRFIAATEAFTAEDLRTATGATFEVSGDDGTFNAQISL